MATSAPPTCHEVVPPEAKSTALTSSYLKAANVFEIVAGRVEKELVELGSPFK